MLEQVDHFIFRDKKTAESSQRRFREFPGIEVSEIERVFIWWKFGYRYKFTVTITYKF